MTIFFIYYTKLCSLKVVDDMKTSLVFILVLATALAGRKYLVKTGQNNNIFDDYRDLFTSLLI